MVLSRCMLDTNINLYHIWSVYDVPRRTVCRSPGRLLSERELRDRSTQRRQVWSVPQLPDRGFGSLQLRVLWRGRKTRRSGGGVLWVPVLWIRRAVRRCEQRLPIRRAVRRCEQRLPIRRADAGWQPHVDFRHGQRCNHQWRPIGWLLWSHGSVR